MFGSVRNSRTGAYNPLNPIVGFTLMELLLAVAVLAGVTAVASVSFATALSAWKRGMALSEDIHHGDLVMEQLVMGLRSAYYPDARDRSAAYGMITENNGDGPGAEDKMSWVKLGRALVGGIPDLAESPHRVEFFVGDDEDGKPCAAVRAWRLQAQPEGFKPEEVKPVVISRRVVGFNCRTAHKIEGGEVEWLDNWEMTNRLPTLVEITLYLAPLEGGGQPVEIKRVVDIPVSHLGWR